MKIKIVFEDDDIIVCHKPAGLATQTNRVGQMDLVSDVRNYLASNTNDKKLPYVGLIHRLDQPVEGILVVAKNQKAASVLSKQILNHQMNKHYYAVVLNTKNSVASDSETLVDYLKQNKRTNSSQVVSLDDKEGKEAILHYQVVKTVEKEKGNTALMDISLVTGRHHQIRVQMSNGGFPLLGDEKYGTDQSKLVSSIEGINHVALCAYQLSFHHPVSGKKQEFTIIPDTHTFAKMFK